MIHPSRPIGILYDHATAYRAFFDLLIQKKIPFIRIKSESHQYNPAEREVPFSILLNLTNPEHTRTRGEAEYIADYLVHIERLGVLVLNGSLAHRLIYSSVRQLELFASLGLAYPQTRILNHTHQVLPAALTFQYPIMIQPNFPSHRQFVLIESNAELQQAVSNGMLEPASPSTLLIQEIIPTRSREVNRLIFVHGHLTAAIKIPFANYSRPSRHLFQPQQISGSYTWQTFEPAAQLIADAARVVKTGKIQYGYVDCIAGSSDQNPYFLKIGIPDAGSARVADLKGIFESLAIALKDQLIPAFESDLIQEAW